MPIGWCSEVSGVLSDGLFEDVAAAFEEICDAEGLEHKPLPWWQDMPLTGRIDELPNLIAKKALQQAHSKLTQLTQHQLEYQPD